MLYKEIQVVSICFARYTRQNVCYYADLRDFSSRTASSSVQKGYDERRILIINFRNRFRESCRYFVYNFEIPHVGISQLFIRSRTMNINIGGTGGGGGGGGYFMNFQIA